VIDCRKAAEFSFVQLHVTIECKSCTRKQLTVVPWHSIQSCSSKVARNSFFLETINFAATVTPDVPTERKIEVQFSTKMFLIILKL
jgi:hypothetical protein